MGSGFPRDHEAVKVLQKDVNYYTPFGPTAPFTHAEIDGREFLYVPFHGITKEIRNTEPDSAAERVFYVLWKAGAKKIIGTALCGSSNRLLDPADVVIPDGFIDYTTKRAQSFFRALQKKGEEVGRVGYRLHQPFCPDISKQLVEGSKKAGFPRVFQTGIVGVAEGPRLESPSEVKMRYAERGIDVVTMNLIPEVFFAREIGACYAALELVSNYGEGLISTTWEGPEAFNTFLETWSKPAAEAIVHALQNLDEDSDSCGCGLNRWESRF